MCRLDRFPRWTLDSTTLLLPKVDRGIIAVDQMTRMAKHEEQVLACVCSYDCELDNKVDRSGVLLAPIKPLPNLSPEDARIIRESWRPISTGPESTGAEEATKSFANYNLFPMVMTISGVKQDVVVDFASMISLADPKKAIGHLVSTKLLEMTDEARRFFQMKIALFMGRPPDQPETGMSE